MVIIDTHTHLYGKQFDNDRPAMMKRAIDFGIKKFYLPAIDSEVIDSMMQMEADYPGICVAMMGLHPCSVAANCKEELQIVGEWLEKRKFPAVGEIGLDFYWDKTFTKEQYEAFHFQIELHRNKTHPVHPKVKYPSCQYDAWPIRYSENA